MPDQATIRMEQERLYESPSLRDDLNDAEAQTLLTWGEGQVERLARDYPDDFEQQARFLRQVIKNINRFVGQREFEDAEGQRKRLDKVMMYLPKLGWEHITTEQIEAGLPEDTSDLPANVRAILHILTPPTVSDDGDEELLPDGV